MMDLISQLPEHILHNILHRLRPKEAVRTCILSKTWSFIQSRNPFLRFAGYNPSTSMLVCAEKHLLRFARNNDIVSSFSFHVSRTCRLYDLRLELMLKLVIMNATQKLDLGVVGYNLPPLALHSRTLTVLILREVKLSGCGENIWLPKLKEICLWYIKDLDDGFVERLLHGCPLLWRLSMDCCKKITSLRVTNSHVRLQCVAIVHCWNLSKVEIEVSNMLDFKYGGISNRSCDLKFNPPKEKLVLCSTKIESCWLQRCKELILFRVHCVNGLVISSPVLSKLVIIGFNNNKENVVTRIDCPNLKSLKYAKNRLPFCSVSEFESLQDIEIYYFIEEDHDYHVIWYDHLKDFFKKLSHNSKELIKQTVRYKKDIIILDGLRDFMIPELCDIKDLVAKEVELISSCQGPNILVDNICEWLNDPSYTSINVVSAHHFSNNKFSKVLWDKLSSNRAEEANCCKKLVHRKCWRHHLCNATKDSAINNVPAALRSHHQYQTTRIMLEWKNQVIDQQIKKNNCAS